VNVARHPRGALALNLCDRYGGLADYQAASTRVRIIAEPGGIKEEAGRALRSALPPSFLRSLAGSAAATAPRTAARPPCPPRPTGGVRTAVQKGRPSALRLSSFIMSISILVARRSALADLSTICVTIASRLVLRRRPSIVTTTVSFSASAQQRRPARGPSCNRCRCPPYAASAVDHRTASGA